MISNLEYLIDRGWVRKAAETKQVQTKSGMVVPSTTCYFHISAEGTDKIEGGSAFQGARFAGINIDATGSNVVTVGDGNYVNVAYQDVYTKLSELRDRIIASADVPEQDKFAAAIEIATVQDQLAKADPEHGDCQTCLAQHREGCRHRRTSRTCIRGREDSWVGLTGLSHSRR